MTERHQVGMSVSNVARGSVAHESVAHESVARSPLAHESVTHAMRMTMIDARRLAAYAPLAHDDGTRGDVGRQRVTYDDVAARRMTMTDARRAWLEVSGG